MKSTGRYSEHEELETSPEKPFLEDIHKDLARIDKHYNKETAAEIKKKMCAVILGTLLMKITRETQLRLAAEHAEDKTTRELLSFFEGMQVIISLMEKKTEDDFYANRLV